MSVPGLAESPNRCLKRRRGPRDFFSRSTGCAAGSRTPLRTLRQKPPPRPTWSRTRQQLTGNACWVRRPTGRTRTLLERKRLIVAVILDDDGAGPCGQPPVPKEPSRHTHERTHKEFSFDPKALDAEKERRQEGQRYKNPDCQGGNDSSRG